MKRTIFLLIGVLLLTSPMFAWYYSVQTSWNGTIHEPGSTTFTPTSTTAYMKMTAPDKSLSCPVCEQDPPLYRDYTAQARLTNGTTDHRVGRKCGGCAKGTKTVNTTDNWTLYAEIVNDCPDGNQEPSWGPVTAVASSTALSNCVGSAPEE